MNKKTTIAALGDIHMNAGQHGKWKSKFEDISHKAKVLLLCGDLTDTGDEEEADLLIAELQSITIPVLAVLGNHDYEKGRQKQIRQILTDNKITVLDGEATVIENIGFAGVKGFGGGFDRYMLSMFGEDGMKSFVQEAVNESLLLDRALARLEQEHADIKKVALLHYAPIAETVYGEPEQIYPFLGSTHLVEPLQRRKVSAAFHGHAHAGKFKALSPTGVPIYNVAVPVLKAHHGNDTCFALIDI